MYLKVGPCPTLMSLADVDAEIASVLAQYHLTFDAYVATGVESPPRLPPGTMDSRAYLERMAELQALSDEGQADVERQIWEFMFGVRPIDGRGFQDRMERLLRSRCELVERLHRAEAERLAAERDAIESHRLKKM